MKPYFFLLILAALTFHQACQSSNKKSRQDDRQHADVLSDSLYLNKGKDIVAATFAALSHQLQQALQRGGVEEAVTYCNVAALPLTDSLSEVHQATIRRTSLQLRNPGNAPDELEMGLLRSYQQMAESEKVLHPGIKRLDEERVLFHSPIKINAFCLQCHGKVGKDISEERYAVINQLYPQDRAIDYQDGDFRGIWSITISE